MDKKVAYKKLESLKKQISKLKRVAVAFSGGVDSTFLLKIASDVLCKESSYKESLYKESIEKEFLDLSKEKEGLSKEGLSKNILCKKVLAVTIDSSVYPNRETKNAINIAKLFNVEHVIIKNDISDSPDFLNNDMNRCYYCKKVHYSKIINIAKQSNLAFVIDGQNFDDLNDYRPGLKAAEQLGIISPLKDNNLTKEEIRFLSKEIGIAGWDKPSFACLASRIPYGTKITEDLLYKIDHLENFLLNEGFKQVRVRHHNDLARIEIAKDEFKMFFKNLVLNKGLIEKIVYEFKNSGYSYITLDLEGYRTGSMNRL